MRSYGTVESGHDVKPGLGEGKSRGREACQYGQGEDGGLG